MLRRVAIIGAGASRTGSITPDLSYRELVFEAATKAYLDAGIEPDDVDTFVACSEDLTEGTSIFDEYVPDQLGAPLKPVHTISADAIFGVISAVMQIQTGMFDIAVVEAHSKASNIVNINEILTMAIDPVFNRPLNFDPHAILGLEMRRFLYITGNKAEHCAQVVVKNRRNALKNPLASFGAVLNVEDVLESEIVSEPLKKLEISEPADGAFVFVLASEDIARNRSPLWIEGMGWCSDAISLDSRDWDTGVYAKVSSQMAYRMAGIKVPAKEICFAEVDDTASFKELQHLEAMGIAEHGRSGELLEQGYFSPEGEIPVNVSGGSLGNGDMLEAKGALKLYHAIQQMKGRAGETQLECTKRSLVQVWRGIPTATGAVVILGC